jgi:bifunctional non-homologous end joining protein LigD
MPITRQKAKRRAGSSGSVPSYIRPQLCELVTAPPVGDNWVHEAKLDGYRTQLYLKNGKLVLFSRNGLDWTHRFPEIAKAGERLDTCIIDGEICAVDAKGLPSFAGLTDALTAKKTKGLVFYAFDMMFGNGDDLMGYPLLTRKKVLKTSLAKLKGADAKRFAFVDHQKGDGSAMQKAACAMGLEGIVSKRIDATYKPDDRSGIWTKAKCRLSQELVVGGWKMTGAAFRSLTVGAYQGGKFVHVGTVGTGYNARNLPELLKALKARASATSPFDASRDPKSLREVHFVKATLVIEAEIASWTSDGLVRQASFKGMREDKPAKRVIVEAPQPPPTH